MRCSSSPRVRRGLDVYCEKPVAYDIREGRAMVDAVKQSDRIVQIGFQRRQSRAMREAVEFIRSGGARQTGPGRRPDPLRGGFE